MGTWGTSLYANDTASDIRGDYVDKLRRGKSNQEVTTELIKENQDIIGDIEEEALFWYALADTQWNYGRLLPEVKEKALFFLSQSIELERWSESGQKQIEAWKNTLKKLKKKLLSPLPPEKKIEKYRLYRCEWKLGDVFAYQFSSAYSREKGFWGQYIVFRKISEDTYWPGHIVPVVQMYKWIGKDIPNLNLVRGMKLLEQGFFPTVLTNCPKIVKEYEVVLLSTSKKVIPYGNLTFLGNLPGKDLIPFRGYDYWNGYTLVGWDGCKYNNSFEQYIIDMYLAWDTND